MSSDKLDNLFRDTLAGYESEVDGEAIWQAVKPRRRRFAIWWFLLGFLILGGVAGGIYWQTSGSPTGASPMEEAALELPASTEELAVGDTQASSLQAASETEHAQGQHITTEQPAELLETTAEAQAGRAHNGPNSLGQEDLPTTPGTASHVTMPTSIPTNTSQTDFAEEELEVLPTSDTDSQTKAEATTDRAQTARERSLLPVMPALDNPIELLPSYRYPLPTDLPVEDSYLRHRYSPWSVSVLAGAHSLQRSFTNNDSLGTDWIGLRKASERNLEAISGEISLTYRLPSRWQVRAGLGWTQINTEFETLQRTTREATVDGIQTIYISPEGDSTFIMGPVTTFETIEQYRKTYNSFRQWDVPLLLGYELDLGHWDLLLEAGVRVNVSQTVEGEIFDAEGQVADLNEVLDYRTSLGLIYQGGLGLTYALTPQLGLQLQTNYRYAPKDFTMDGSSIGERYHLLGAQAGLRWRF